MSDFQKTGETKASDENRTTLLDILCALVKGRWFIIGSTITGAVLVVLFSLYTKLLPADSPFNPLPDLYRPEARIMLTWAGVQEQMSSGSQSTRINPAIFMAIPGLPNPYFELVKEILFGNALLDQLAEKLDLIEKFKLQDSDRPKTAVRGKIKDKMQLLKITGTPVPLFSIFEVRYVSIDPVFAVQVLNTSLVLLEENLNNIIKQQVTTRKNFIEERMFLVEDEMSKYKDKIFQFQKKYGVIDISTQAKEQTKLIADLSSTIMKKELEIQTSSKYLGESDPRIVLKKDEINANRQLIDDIKNKFTGEFIPLNKIPQINAEYMELDQGLQIQVKIYAVLKQEYEKAKIDEINSLNNFKVIQPPEKPESKYAPRRSQLCMIVTAMMFFISVAWVIFREYFSKLAQDPRTGAGIKKLKSSFKKQK